MLLTTNILIADWTKKWAEHKKQNFMFYTQTTSTNTKAKEIFLNDPKKYQKMLFITQSQTQGKGRRNKKWIDSDFMVTWSYFIQQAPQPITTILMGLAVHTALKKTWDCPFKIKTPNDIYIKGKKSAGLLIEVINKSNLHQLIIGFGMNVFTHPTGFTDLQKNIKIKITQKQWFNFLSEWDKQINLKIKYCTKDKLSKTDECILAEIILK